MIEKIIRNIEGFTGAMFYLYGIAFSIASLGFFLGELPRCVWPMAGSLVACITLMVVVAKKLPSWLLSCSFLRISVALAGSVLQFCFFFGGMLLWSKYFY